MSSANVLSSSAIAITQTDVGEAIVYENIEDPSLFYKHDGNYDSEEGAGSEGEDYQGCCEHGLELSSVLVF